MTVIFKDNNRKEYVENIWNLIECLHFFRFNGYMNAY